MKRRELDLRSGEEVIQEIERLRNAGYVRCGTWNLSQVCEHLDKTMQLGMQGGDFRLPKILRATLGKWFFRRALSKRKLPSGLPSHKSLMPGGNEIVDSEPTIDACIATLRKASDFKGPIKNYPLLDHVEPSLWREMMWIHAAHHLSFLLPKSAQQETSWQDQAKQA